MAPRLKVFEWSDGFHRFTVAASSRPKAREAWGIQQDIFSSGLAREAPESDDAAAARAAPGQVIERGLVVDVGEAGPRRPKKTSSGPTPAQKRKVEALAARIVALDQAHDKASQRSAQEIKLMKARHDDEQRRFNLDRDQLTKALDAAKQIP